MKIILYLLAGAFLGNCLLLFWQGVAQINRTADENIEIIYLNELLKLRIKSWWKIARLLKDEEKHVKLLQAANQSIENERTKLYIELGALKAAQVRSKIGPHKDNGTSYVDKNGKFIDKKI